jgi:hypothetical protein
MTITVAQSELDVRYAEVESLGLDGDVERAPRRLLDFAREFGAERGRIVAAQSLAAEFAQLHKQERQFGQTDGTRATHARLLDRFFALLGEVREDVESGRSLNRSNVPPIQLRTPATSNPPPAKAPHGGERLPFFEAMALVFSGEQAMSDFRSRWALVALIVGLGIVLPARGAAPPTRTSADKLCVVLEARHVVPHTGRTSHFYFSRGGKRFASDEGCSLRVWDTGTWKQLASFKAHEDVLLLHLSADGTLLAFSEGGSSDVQLFSVTTGKVVRTLPVPKGGAVGRFSPDGTTFIMVGVFGEVRLWNVKTGRKLDRAFPKADRSVYGEVRAYGLSPDGRILALARKAPSGDSVSLLDLSKGTKLRTLLTEEGVGQYSMPSSIAFSPCGRGLALGDSRENLVTVWDLADGSICQRLRWPKAIGPGDKKQPSLVLKWDPRESPGVEELAYSRDGKCLYVGYYDRRLHVWEVATGQERYRVAGVEGLVMAEQAWLFAMSAGAGKVRVFDPRSCVPPLRPSTPADKNKAWADLGSDDAAKAYTFMTQLRAMPGDAVALLDTHLPTAAAVKAATLERLVREMDDEEQDVRIQARVRLEELGDVARSVLTAALRKAESLEARRSIKQLLAALDGRPSGERLRVLRAVEVLECIGSPAARRTLKRLAGGAPEAQLTREAKAALERLESEG